MDQLIFEIIVLVCCAGLAAFFSGAESALFSITKPAIHRLSQSKNRSEKLLYGLMKDPQKILITILTGNLFANLVISTVFTKLLLKQWPHWGHLISIAIVAPVLIIFCEITPKIIALNSFESTSKRLLPLLRFFHILLLPVRLLLLLFTDAMIRMIVDSDPRSNRNELPIRSFILCLCFADHSDMDSCRRPHQKPGRQPAFSFVNRQS